MGVAARTRWLPKYFCPQKYTCCAAVIFFNLDTYQPDFDDSKRKTLVLSETNVAQGSLESDGGSYSHQVTAEIEKLGTQKKTKLKILVKPEQTNLQTISVSICDTTRSTFGLYPECAPLGMLPGYENPAGLRPPPHSGCRPGNCSGYAPGHSPGVAPPGQRRRLPQETVADTLGAIFIHAPSDLPHQ